MTNQSFMSSFNFTGSQRKYKINESDTVENSYTIMPANTYVFAYAI